MPYRQRPAPVGLRDDLKCCWMVEREFGGGDDGWDVLPDRYVELVFHFGAACRLREAAGVERELPRAYAVGLLDKPFRLLARGRLVTIGARLYPWGYARLFGAAIGAPAGSVSALDGALGTTAEAIGAALAGAGDDAALATLEAQLIARARHAAVSHPRLPSGARAALAGDDDVSIARLAERCRLSPRQLERRFRAAVGVTPKSMARRARFERVRDALWRSPRTDLAALAHALGYADQAHLAREFRYFAGQTPRQFAARMRATQAALRVAFVQDR